MTVITILKQLGYKVTSRETTAGAIKWWLNYPDNNQPSSRSRKRVLKALGLTQKDKGTFNGDYYGCGFEINFQTQAEHGYDAVFVVKPRRTKAGQSYQAGIDC